MARPLCVCVQVMNSATCVYMVLELVRGAELYDEIVGSGQLPEARARRYMREIIDGLRYLHSQVSSARLSVAAAVVNSSAAARLLCAITHGKGGRERP
jgi:serine/threonine protein kinase